MKVEEKNREDGSTYKVLHADEGKAIVAKKYLETKEGDFIACSIVYVGICGDESEYTEVTLEESEILAKEYQEKEEKEFQEKYKEYMNNK